MLTRLTPFFNMDGDGGWGEVFTPNADPVDDVQPEGDTDTEVLDEGLEADEGQDEVEPDPEAEEAETLDDKPAFDDETEIDLGDGRQAVKLAELKQGYLRQSDYTKKTQELATQRKEFEAEVQSWEPTKQWVDYISNNPYLFEQVNRAIQQWNQTGDADWDAMMQDADIAKWVNGFRVEAAKHAKRAQELEAKYGDLEFSTTMKDLKSDLKAEYGDLVTNEYLSTLQERAKSEKLPLSVVKEIADGHLAKLKFQQEQKKSKKVEAETIRSIQEKRKSVPPGPTSRGQTPSVPKNVDYDSDWGTFFKSVR